MIITTLNSLANYSSMNVHISDVLEFINANDANKLTNGKVEIKGDELFAIVMRPETKVYQTEKLEAHRKYIDIHWVISGTELFGWKDLSRTHNQMGEFNVNDDFVLYNDPDYSSILLNENDMVIAFPEDAHAPTLETNNLFKIVFKLKV